MGRTLRSPADGTYFVPAFLFLFTAAAPSTFPNPGDDIVVEVACIRGNQVSPRLAGAAGR